MARSLDGLVKHLLDEIALCGEKGARFSDVFDYVNNYFALPLRSRAAPDPGLDHSASSQSSGPIETYAPESQSSWIQPGSQKTKSPGLIDRRYKQRIWQWISAHPEIRLRRGKELQSLSFDEAERNEQQRLEHNDRIARPGSLEQENFDVAQDSSASPANSEWLSIHVSEHSVWQALTGHGVDWSRCPRSEFNLLCAIAECRERGIAQPDLQKKTGQDKRSLPRRADQLHIKGYIVKKPVLFKGFKTSHLVLRKYSSGSDASQDPAGNNDQERSGSWTKSSSIDIDAMMNAMFSLLRKLQVIPYDELKFKLGIMDLPWQRKVFSRIVRKLEATGCLRRVYANPDPSKLALGPRCVKLVREPEKKEWHQAWSLIMPDNAQPEVGPDLTADIDTQAETAMSSRAADSSTEPTTTLRDIKRRIPLWVPTRSLPNLLFKLIEDSSTSGMSTMELKDRSVGQFLPRPLETQLERLTENFTISQPAHVRHLSLIRDTSQVKKAINYHYYTFLNFQELVDRGEASWDAIQCGVKEDRQRGAARPKFHSAAKQRASIAINDHSHTFGFAPLNPNDFLKEGGNISLSGAVAALKVKNIENPTGDPWLSTNADGTYDIQWSKRKDELMAVHPRRRSLGDALVKPKKPLGRPRKNVRQRKPQLNQELSASENILTADSGAKRSVTEAGLDDTTQRPAIGSEDELIQTPVPPLPKRARIGRFVGNREFDLASADAIRTETQNESAARNADEQTNCYEDGAGSGEDSHMSEVILGREEVLATTPASEHIGARVLINPPGSERPPPAQPRRGRKRKSLIVVIRSGDMSFLECLARQQSVPNEVPLVVNPTPTRKSLPLKSLEADRRQGQQKRKRDKSLPHNNNCVQVSPGAETEHGAESKKRRLTDAVPDDAQASPQSSIQLPLSTPQPADLLVIEGADAESQMSHDERNKPLLPDEENLRDHATATANLAIEDPQPEPANHTRDSLGQNGEWNLERGHSKPHTSQSGSLTLRRKRHLLSIVDDASGVFPGDKELWYAYAFKWMQENPQSGKPDTKTVAKIQKSLVDSGQLKIIKFVFKNSKGLQVQKKILARNSIATDSALVVALRDKIIEADCKLCIPPEFGVTSDVKKKLSSYMQTHASRTRRRAGDPVERLTEEESSKLQMEAPPRKRKSARSSAKSATFYPGSFSEPGWEIKFDQEVRKGYVELNPEERRDARRDLSRFSQSFFMSSFQGPPRVAGLHSLQDRLQRHGQQSRQHKPNALGSGPIEERMIGEFENHSLRSTPLQYSRGIDLRRPDQRYHQASGTFGTFFPYRATQAVPSSGGINLMLPRTLEEMIGSIPRGRRVNHNLSSDPMRRMFDYQVDKVRAWETKQGDHLISKQPVGFNFINHTLPQETLSTGDQAVNLKWVGLPPPDDDVQASPESEPHSPPPATPAPVALSPDFSTTARPSKAKERFKVRSLTAPPPEYSGTTWPSEASTWGPDVVEVESFDHAIPGQSATISFVDVSMLISHIGVKRQRRSRAWLETATMTEEEIRTLLTAIVVVRTLTGGVGKSIDWVIVAILFPAYDRAFLQKKWNSFKNRFRGQMDRLQADFQRAYLAAYDAAEVPSIDYDNLLSYDWPGIVAWAQNVLDVPTSHKLPNLPRSRKKLEEFYSLSREYEPPSAIQDDFFGLTMPVFKRMKLAYSTTMSSLILDEPKKSAADEEQQHHLHLAESWVRANVITPESDYDPQAATEKLSRLGPAWLDLALEHLKSEHVITHVNKGRLMPGRNYDITEQFLTSLKRPLEEKHFKSAAEYKAGLDQTFSTGTSTSAVSYFAGDGEVLALINLLASGQVRLLPGNIPSDKFGLMDGSYKTRFMDKSRLAVSLSVQATPTYTYSRGNALRLTPPPQQHLVDENLPVPIWFDLHGNFMLAMWYKALAAVLSILATRPGLTLISMQRLMKPSLRQWELGLIVDWMVQVGAARKIGDGWVADTHWWTLMDPSPSSS
ncbi:MAG: hypothetical protein M1825_003293 [Sarcosagium campestre]|nr:MAG: hypothetical protein M1825_003293 [Sarcosagium campestre]